MGPIPISPVPCSPTYRGSTVIYTFPELYSYTLNLFCDEQARVSQKQNLSLVLFQSWQD